MAKAAQTSRVHVTLSQDHTFRVDNSTKRTLPAKWAGYVSEKIAKDIEKEKHGKRTPTSEIPEDARPAPAPKGRAKVSGSDSTAAGGNDTSSGGSGADTVAGSGTDTTNGGAGADTVSG